MLFGEVVTAGDFPELFINRVLSIPRPQVFAGTVQRAISALKCENHN